MSDYIKKVKQVIEKHTGLERSEILESSFFEDDLNIGELEMVDILSELEEEFQIELMDNKDNFETVQDLAEAIAEQSE